MRVDRRRTCGQASRQQAGGRTGQAIADSHTPASGRNSEYDVYEEHQ